MVHSEEDASLAAAVAAEGRLRISTSALLLKSQIGVGFKYNRSRFVVGG